MIILKRTLVFKLLWLSVLISSAQTANLIDSLNQELNQEGLTNKRQAKIHILLAKEYAESSPSLGLDHIDKASKLLQPEPNDSLLVHLLLAKSTSYSYLAQYDSSTALSIQGLKLAEANADTVAMLDASNNLGIDFMYTEDYESSFQYFSQLIDLAKLAKDSLRLGHGLNNLGLTEYYRGNEDLELRYYLQAQQIFENIGEQEGLGNTLLNIGTIYTSSGEHELAFSYYQRALVLFELIGYKSAQANVLQSISEDYMEQGKLQQAEKYAFDALEILQANELNQDIAYTYDLLQQVYIKANNYKQSHKYLTLYHEVQDEIFNEEKSQQIIELQTRYETSKKEAEIEQLAYANDVQELQLSTARNQMIAMSVSGVLMIITGIILFVFRNKRLAAERLAQEHQLDALKQRLLQLQVEDDSLDFAVELDDLNGRINTPLTEREYDTLSLSITGKSNQEIADELFVSVNTVKFHLRNIYQKLGVNNKKEVLAYVAKTS